MARVVRFSTLRDFEMEELLHDEGSGFIAIFEMGDSDNNEDSRTKE